MQPRISPSGERVAFTRPDDKTGNRDVWYTEISRGITVRVTGNIANDWYPVWGPGGKRLLFGSDRDGGTALPAYVKEALDVSSADVSLAGEWAHEDLVDPPMTKQTFGYPFDAVDGQRFLVNCRVQPAGGYVVLLNKLPQ